MSSVILPTPNPTSPAWSEYIDNQSFNITGLNGKPLTLTFGEINHFYYNYMCEMTIFGFTVGSTGILMIVLLVSTDRKKARRPIFILNFLCLLLLCIREILFLAYLLKVECYGFGEAILDAVAQFPRSDYVPLDISFMILDLILYPCIFASLILQVRVVFSAEPRSRLIVTIILVTIGVVDEAFWLTYLSWALCSVFAPPGEIRTVDSFVYTTVEWIFVGFVGLCCLLFLYKLFIIIYRRRRMGLRSFGPLHILFIMFGQCLVTPRASSAIFCVF
jgi:pheromone alpha factor receptor